MPDENVPSELHEVDIEDFFVNHPSLIEDGFQVLERQKYTITGKIDIFGKDREDNYVIVPIYFLKSPMFESMIYQHQCRSLLF